LDGHFWSDKSQQLKSQYSGQQTLLLKWTEQARMLKQVFLLRKNLQNVQSYSLMKNL
jgi:hypothetical protein